ncbi:MAG: fumarate hydrolyase [Denitrovibrio sp.]|nr:MAG: fumarate hydrolyase [Denitrovibrio sp.]
MIKLTTPISEETARSLKVGDEILLTGKIVTARDAAHKLMIEEKPEFIREHLLDGVIYHCGPVVKEENGEYSFVAAGPTTSSREEPYQATVCEEYSVRAVIGKGGMGPKTAAGLEKVGAVYLHAVGGAGSLIGKMVKKVHTVFMLEELGTPEAFWVCEVEDFPCVVTMDSHGGSLHKDIAAASQKVADDLMGL